MRWSKLGSGLVVALVIVALVGIVANFVVENTLFFASDMEAAAIVSLLFVLVALLAFMAIGRPWGRWNRTAYW